MIGGLGLYNYLKNSGNQDIDRKVHHIFNKYSYGLVVREGKDLFINTVKYSNINNFEYERDDKRDIKYYALENCTKCKKILNINELFNRVTIADFTKFRNDYQIIEQKNSYYMADSKEKINQNYIGSIVKLKSYDENYAYFESTNYYCQNDKYIGLLEQEPSCEYTKTITNFKVTDENNTLKIVDLEEISKILQ